MFGSNKSLGSFFTYVSIVFGVTFFSSVSEGRSYCDRADSKEWQVELGIVELGRPVTIVEANRICQDMAEDDVDLPDSRSRIKSKALQEGSQLYGQPCGSDRCGDPAKIETCTYTKRYTPGPQRGKKYWYTWFGDFLPFPENQGLSGGSLNRSWPTGFIDDAGFHVNLKTALKRGIVRCEVSVKLLWGCLNPCS